MAKTIVVFSTKGGVGKTFIASNLAVALAREESGRVLLIDLDLQVVGDMSRMLGLKPQRTVADLIQVIQAREKIEYDKIILEEFLTHAAFGIDFLPGVLRPQQSVHVEPSRIKGTFGFLEKKYDYIIVDAGKSFSEVFVSALNQANLILLVATPDILSVYQTKWALDTLQFLHFPLDMIRVVLNRAESESSISWQEVRATLPVEIIARLPSEGKSVGLAVNRGVPVVIDNPAARITKAIKKFASDLANNEQLFIEHQEIDQLKLKETRVEKTGEFWQAEDLTEALGEVEKYQKTDEILLLKSRLHTRLIYEMNLKKLDVKVFTDPKKSKDLRNKAETVVTNLLSKELGSFISSQEVRKKLIKEILDEALGLGPLEDLLADPEITDIMVNNKDEVYIERRGKLEVTNKKFISNEQVRTIIERIIAPIGRRIDESVPMVDARLPDGSRVNAIIPPLSLTGPTLTIRKFRKERFKIEELIQLNTLSQNMADFLMACVLARKNMVVSGGTGSGKTTVLNVLSEFIPPGERIVTIEDAAELKLSQEDWVRLESRTANIEGRGAISVRDLFRNTLRMRPDRIIIGECRGVETLDMLQAMNTGHDGSLTTIHANSTQDVLVRLDSMILMAGVELPLKAIREMISSAMHLIIHTARLSDGSRKIIQITEVAGMKDEVHVELKDIFIFLQTGVDGQGNVLGHFAAVGNIPKFFEEIKIKGILLSEDIFQPTPSSENNQ